MMDEDIAPEARRNRGFLGFDSSALSARDRQDRRQLRYELDLNTWNLRIWGVAASGFFTDSYNLFSTNVILTSMSFVYFPGHRWPGLLINLFTLFGSALGQLLFGYLADCYGRTRLYGIELLLVIVSTIGVATGSSAGYNSLSFLGLFIWWRFVMGIGIGAEYPLSAVITSEWASTQSRATMLGSVFLMQPVGQAVAQLVALWVISGRESEHHLRDMRCGIDTKYDTECKQLVDGMWRVVIGSGAVPALLAIIFRFFLYDCGLYQLEVKHKPGVALRDMRRLYVSQVGARNSIMMRNSPGATQIRTAQPQPSQFSTEDLYNYFFRDGNWYYLIGTSMTWLILDAGFYGFSLDSRATLADLWASTSRPLVDSSLSCWNSSFPGGNSTLPSWKDKYNGLPAWQTDATKPCNSLYDVLVEQAKQYLLTVSISSIAGSTCFIFFANRFPRKHWLTSSFLVLAVLFVIIGGLYYGVAHTFRAPAIVIFVAICHFAFNFGANTLTFIIPAEIYPTCYRCTCHGISAAAGKLGSIMALLIVYGINAGYTDPNRQGLVFILFGSILALGAIYSWAYLPHVQRLLRDDDGREVLETKTLEELGGGREQARIEGEIITVRDKMNEARRRRKERLGSQGVSHDPQSQARN
ncbi:major facilitator superfamily domain-containing protein [Pseudomassariella vexata]|uniref:Major facilitator superfamily domain-containing protein n=1 Tax=Pseudomassariella vexata TaxID=1141098 RepID=A0A1Y2E4J3_9PEZI|nr:major facilitator superfamily domain-containing protein [Pseudomassariella vexata]ORY66471.1 major facilitator superfamily domain-containing protein [Pseudomassariella vexata]